MLLHGQVLDGNRFEEVQAEIFFTTDKCLLQCSSKHVHSEVNPIEFCGAYSLVRVPKTDTFISNALFLNIRYAKSAILLSKPK